MQIVKNKPSTSGKKQYSVQIICSIRMRTAYYLLLDLLLARGNLALDLFLTRGDLASYL